MVVLLVLVDRGTRGAWTNVETYKAKVGNDVAVLVTVARFGKNQVNQVDSAELPVVRADIAQTQDGLWLVLVVIGHDTAWNRMGRSFMWQGSSIQTEVMSQDGTLAWLTFSIYCAISVRRSSISYGFTRWN